MPGESRCPSSAADYGDCRAVHSLAGRVLPRARRPRPRSHALRQSGVQTAIATSNYFRKAGTPEIVPVDTGSTDANDAISLGIPAVAVGATPAYMFHQLGENAEASSIVPGIKSLIALAVALTNH